MEKKYQVFVSSTYEDLKEERQKVMEMLLYKNCIPVGMEYFPATNDEQMKIIKQLIDECDYYILILGGRYGSIDHKTSKSYTRLEYEYALEKGIPIAAFYKEDKNIIPHGKTDNLDKLEEFENLVKQKMCKSWNNGDDLAGKVSMSLDYLFKHNPRYGWVKANNISSDEANNELLRLKKENNTLKTQLDFLTSSVPQGIESFQQGDESFTLHYTNVMSDYAGTTPKIYTKEVTWNKLFLSISTSLLKPINEVGIKRKLEETLLTNFDDIEEDDFQTILVQFMALKLINVDTIKYDGIYTYWLLTPYGRNEMVRLKAIRKNS